MMFFRRKQPEKKKKNRQWDKAIAEAFDCTANESSENEDFMVTLDTINKVNRFANICQVLPVTVTLKNEKGTEIAGDSIMGIFSMCLLTPVEGKIGGKPTDIRTFFDRLKQEGIASEIRTS